MAVDDQERRVIERGAVEGQVFHRGAVTALAPESLREAVPHRLLSLVRKELVRPDRAQITGDDAYRFRHLLIRDTAYEALSKAIRADLHERFAGWLSAHGELLELDEILGYHLEQAARYLQELDAAEPRAQELALRAAERLGTAGTAAFEREDHHATRNLLGRAVALLPAGARRRSLIPDLVDARLLAGDTVGLGELIDELAEGDERERATGDVLCAHAELTSGSGRKFRELMDVVRAACPTLEAVGDEMGVIRAERVLEQLAWALGQAGVAHDYACSIHDRLRRLGSTAYQSEIVGAVQVSAVFGGRPHEEIRRLFDELYGEAEEAGPLLAASLRAARARLDYNTGVIGGDEVIAAVEHLAELQHQTGSPLEALISRNFLCKLAWLEGDDAAAEARCRRRVADFDALGDRLYLASALADWGESLCRLGDAEAALRAVERGRSLARPDDVADQVVLDVTEAYARALLGAPERTDELLARARAALEAVDMVILSEYAEYVEARARLALGDVDGARSRLERLRDATEAGGRPRWADAYRHDLAALDG